MQKNQIFSGIILFIFVSFLPSQILAEGKETRVVRSKTECHHHSKKSRCHRAPSALACIETRKAQESMQKLFEAFVAVDEGFNTVGGLTVDQIVQLGYFGPLTTTIAFGPFTPDVCGHTNHTNQPGAFQAIGPVESAALQVLFEGGLLQDPNFPYQNLNDAPKLFHTFPYITACLGNDLVNVIATADVRYPGVNGPLVARVSSLAQYRLRTNSCGEVIIPEIVWIQFFITYFDCQN